jgi:hypothetical protein
MAAQIDVDSDGNEYVLSLEAGLSLESPVLTGMPTAPTAAAGVNTTQVATTAFVGTAVSGEAEARIAADNAEASTRAAAVSGEAAARTAAVNAEASTRATAVSDEATARIAADNAEASTRASAVSSEASTRSTEDAKKIDKATSIAGVYLSTSESSAKSYSQSYTTTLVFYPEV